MISLPQSTSRCPLDAFVGQAPSADCGTSRPHPLQSFRQCLKRA